VTVTARSATWRGARWLRLLAPDPFPGPSGLARRSAWVAAGSFAVFMLIGLVTEAADLPARAAVGAALAVVAGSLLFATRSRWILVWAVAASAGVAVMAGGDTHDVGWFALAVIAAWTVLSGGVRLGAAVGAGVVLLLVGEWLWAKPDPGWAPWIGGITLTVVFSVLVRHQFVLVERLRAAHANLAEQSRLEERARIARELHDVIAHGLTVSLLHVESARLAVEHDPADAACALAEAERLGRSTLEEVRATVGLIRPDRTPGIAAPAPRIDQVAGLVQTVRDSGVEVALDVNGDIGSVAPTTGATIYRIVQEALTNAARHGAGWPVSVQLTVAERCVSVAVDSAGPPGVNRGGTGLIGIRERAAAVGGTCEAGPGGTGWLVQARLPLVGTGS